MAELGDTKVVTDRGFSFGVSIGVVRDCEPHGYSLLLDLETGEVLNVGCLYGA